LQEVNFTQPLRENLRAFKMAALQGRGVHPMNRPVAMAALCLFTAMIPVPSLAFDLPGFETSEAVVEEILTPLMHNDQDVFAETMARLFGDGGAQIDHLVFDSFLSEGETFVLRDKLKTDKLGTTLVRYLYALRTSDDDYLFLMISAADTSRGWVAYDFDIKSDLGKFLPGWDSP
jgi:hypothetical protein